MRSLNALIWRNLTAHPLRSILTLLAIALGVAMVLAASIVGQAAGQSTAELSEEGPNVDLEIISRDGVSFDDDVLDALRASPDVDLASPSLRVEAELGAPPITELTLLGVDPESYSTLHEPELAGGAFLDEPDTIVLPMAMIINHRLSVGDEVTVAAGGRRVTLTVAGRLSVGQDGILPYGGQPPTAFVLLHTAQTLADALGQVDRVEVALRPGADAVRVKTDLAQAVSPDLAVVRAVATEGAMGNVVLMQASLAIVGLIILFAASFVILNAFAMSVTGRTREIGALRALGMTRRQVLSTVMAEAGLLGLAGTAAGVLVGLGLAWAVMRTFGNLKDAPFTVPWWGLGLSAVLGLAVTLVAALQPAWRASRVSPIVAVRPETATADGWYVRSGGRVGAVLLALLLPGLTALGLLARPNIAVALPVMVLGQSVLLGAVVLLLPALIAPVTTLCRSLLARWLGTAGRLAADNLGRNKLRAVLTAGALTAGLTIIVATSGLMTAGLKGAVSSMRSAAGNEDVFITGDLAEIVASQELTFDNFFEFLTQDDLGFDLNQAVDALDPLVEAGQIKVIRYRFQVVPPDLASIPGAPGLFVDPEVYVSIGNFDFFEGDSQTALAWMQRGRAMLLTPIVAERLGAEVGDEVPVQTPHGKVAFTVAGIGGGGFLMTVFPYADGEIYFDVSKPSFLGIAVAEGENVEATLVQVEAAIEPFPEITLLDYDESLDPVLEIVDRLSLLLDGLLLLAVVVAALGVVNTMVINVTEQGREIGLLRAVGATQRQVRQAVVVKAAMLGLLAALVASGLGLLMLLTWGVLILPNGTASVGVRADWETVRLTLGAGLRDAGIASLVALIFGPLVAALAAYYPARQAAALDIVEATRSERVTLKRTPPGRRRVERSAQRLRAARSFTWMMAWRNLEQGRTRAILSALAVALGAAMIVASSVVNSGVRDAWTSGESSMAWVADMIDVVFTSVGVIILAASGFLIFNAFAMTVTQQRRQIGALRSLGMTRRQVMRQVLVEALTTGGLGTLVGLIAGPMFGRGILAWMKQMDLDVGSGSVSLASVLLAVVMALGITLLSVLVPARRATRVSPLTAIREHKPTGQQAGEAARRRTRARVGLAMLGVMTVYLIIAPPGEWSGGAPPWEWIMWLSLWGVWIVGWLLVLPVLVAGLTRLLRVPLNRFGGTIGRLIADNLEREPRRVALTVLTFAVGLTMIVGVGGLLAFSNGVLVMRTAEHGLQQSAWFVYSFDRTQGMAQLGSFDTEAMGLEPVIVEEIHQVTAGRADVDEVYMVSVPETSAIMPGFPSSVMTLHYMTRPDGFRFIEGDWETALPMMESGCGLLVPPGVTTRHKARIGDTLTVQGRDGPVECKVAGIGVGGMIPFSIIGIAAKDAFLPPDQPPDSLGIHPLPGADVQALEADLYALSDRHGDKVWISKPEEEISAVTDTSDQLQGMLNGLLLLAEIAAALGMINTTVMSIAERRRELGLLRAVGATRRQVTAVILSEAALMGLVGAGLGVVAGVGLGAIFALAYGGISFGLVDLPLWEAAGETVLPALRTGWLGFVVAPLLAAAAAYPAIRAILRGSTIETMEPERQVQRTLEVRRTWWHRGSVRTRFVFGTAALMVVVLAGLIGVVTTHACIRIEEQMHDALRTLVTWNAGMIKLSLPEDAETLDLNTLQMGQAFDFDSDTLLQFESLVDGMTDNGLVDFTIADRDDVVLISLDVREIGTLAPELEASAEAHVRSEREGDEWLMHANAPIRTADDWVVGSVRLTVDAREIQGFLSDLRNTLAAAGSAIILIVLAISWRLSTPLVSLFDRLKQRGLRSRFSLRTQLTVAMALILILMVGALELVAVPIERHHVEDTLKQGLVAASEWIGQAASESFDIELSDLSPGQTLPFEELIEMTETLDLARLQELTDQIKSDDAAYVALVDDAGTIVLSDQFALIGEEVSTPPDTQIEEATWRDEEIWVTTTPLRRGRGGEQMGALRMGVRRVGVETFLDESRNLFRLTGLIAVLAGVLLAQAIGGAVAVPARQMVTNARRVEEGDLLVQLGTGAQDELVILATAYNQMVLGLQEREWLRDMFGRFVSHEVAEAIRTGQVRLAGENRVVSILFCDIRGFTARSEQSTPEETVALLNEYLPVVVGAAQRHEGTVNKFGGDSTLVIYGAPRHLQESAYQAVLTALEIRASLRALNAKLIERGKDPIRIGVGINTGVALAGAVGPEERQEYAVIGDTVNLASRIEALNKQYPDHDILISGWTYEALGSRRREFEFTDLGEVRMQDKVEPVRVWAVVGSHYEP